MERCFSLWTHFFPFVVIRFKNWDVSRENGAQHHRCVYACVCVFRSHKKPLRDNEFRIILLSRFFFVRSNFTHSGPSLFFRTSITYQFIHIIIDMYVSDDIDEVKRRRDGTELHRGKKNTEWKEISLWAVGTISWFSSASRMRFGIGKSTAVEVKPFHIKTIVYLVRFWKHHLIFHLIKKINRI